MTNPVKNYRARTPNNQPNPIDVFIGGRIRYFRKLRHVSQVELAGSVGTTFQQVQKYENGNNRVSGSRLWMISQVLQVPVSLFFEGINVKTGRSSVKSFPAKKKPFIVRRISLCRCRYKEKNRNRPKKAFAAWRSGSC